MEYKYQQGMWLLLVKCEVDTLQQKAKTHSKENNVIFMSYDSCNNRKYFAPRSL